MHWEGFHILFTLILFASNSISTMFEADWAKSQDAEEKRVFGDSFCRAFRSALLAVDRIA
jgi:hypothetical protein